jgi:hypothetical protein
MHSIGGHGNAVIGGYADEAYRYAPVLRQIEASTDLISVFENVAMHT